MTITYARVLYAGTTPKKKKPVGSPVGRRFTDKAASDGTSATLIVTTCSAPHSSCSAFSALLYSAMPSLPAVVSRGKTILGSGFAGLARKLASVLTLGSIYA